MAKRNDIPQGSWLLAEELLESGDSSFLDELCRIHDADRLGSFAVAWYKDGRPASRKLLLEYLGRPLATYRHEPLVKRLFKNAAANNDDEVMAHFMVAVDRIVRRKRRTRHRYDWSTRESWTEESASVPQGTQMPKDARVYRYQASRSSDAFAESRLFTVATRNYLRRRAWRYFRTIGKQDPVRYVKGMATALALYTDEDCKDGLALIDNRSLIHVLFHHTDVLRATTGNWALEDGQALKNLKPAPAFADAWTADASVLVDLLGTARCRAVRQWTITMLKENHPDALRNVPLETILKWVCSEDESLADLAAEALDRIAAASGISAAGWVRLTEEANGQVLDRICELMLKHVSSNALTITEILQLACAQPMPVAKAGLHWLKGRTPASPDDCLIMLQVAEAKAETLRPELIDVVRKKISDSDYFQAPWVLELLDSRHENVRDVGWQWLLDEERAAGDVTTWQRLMETPYDDIHLRLVKLLEAESTRPDQPHPVSAKKLDDKLLRHLWSSVLLNVHRGGRQKPGVVTGIIHRLEKQPNEAADLLPLLSVALRSVRTVEWRAALSGIVQLVERRPEMANTIRDAFPELSIA